jgi:hypothetical protein
MMGAIAAILSVIPAVMTVRWLLNRNRTPVGVQ